MNLSANLFAEVHKYFVCVRRMYMGLKLALDPFVASDIEEMSDNKGRLYTLNLRKHRERSLLTYTYRKELPFFFALFSVWSFHFFIASVFLVLRKTASKWRECYLKKLPFSYGQSSHRLKEREREREKERERERERKWFSILIVTCLCFILTTTNAW